MQLERSEKVKKLREQRKFGKKVSPLFSKVDDRTQAKKPQINQSV